MQNDWNARAFDSSDFDGNTNLVDSDDVIGYNKYVFNSGFKVIKFTTEDKIIDFVSLKDNIMIPTAKAVRTKDKCFKSDHRNFNENNKIEEGTLIKATNDSLDPYDHHLAKCGEGAFEMMECNQIHSFYLKKEAKEDDEAEVFWRAQRELDDWVEEQRNLDKCGYCNGNNQMVNIFNQKSVICFENPSLYAFRHCGHPYIWKSSYQNKGDVDILKRVIGRT